MGPVPTQQPVCKSRSALTANQPEDQFHSLTCQQHSGLNYNRKAHTIHTRDIPEAPGLGERGHYTTGPHRYLLHKTNLPKLGDAADLPNTEKQTQMSDQNEETKEMSQMKEQEKSPEKKNETKWRHTIYQIQNSKHLL